MQTTMPYDAIAVGATIEGPAFSVTRESIAEFAAASLDFNPLHLDDGYMQGNFGKSRFDGIIMHGMTNFGLITRMMTDWLSTVDGIHRRLETRWLKPVKPGDTIRPRATVTKKLVTAKSRWLVCTIEVRNDRDETVASGEATAEFPY